jgi:hypothetical protein
VAAASLQLEERGALALLASLTLAAIGRKRTGSDYLSRSSGELRAAFRDQPRALVSLKLRKDEVAAVDRCSQRAAVCDDGELRSILLHNRDRDEEIERACMTHE